MNSILCYNLAGNYAILHFHLVLISLDYGYVPYPH
jgi:hypothetical protein